MYRHPIVYLVVLLIAAALPLGGAARGQGHDPERTAAVKAGMVINFLRYTTWPEQSFTDEAAPIIIAVVGDTQVDEVLEAATRGRAIGGRAVEVRRLRHPASEPGGTTPREEDLSEFYRALRATHAAYLAHSEQGRADDMLRELRGSSVLTISEIDGFARSGGMLGFTMRERRVAFDANPDAIREAALQVSSQVLKLATIVGMQPRDPEDRP